MTIQISKPTEKDLDGIQDVYYRTYLDTYPNAVIGITREDIEVHFKKDRELSAEDQEKRKQHMLRPPENHLFLVAKDGEEVVGVCRMIQRETVNQLQAIYVLPEYQGQGVGSMLWKECLGFADPLKETIVQLATYNEKAKVFYSKRGFVDTGKRLTEERHRMPVSGVLIPEMEMVLKIGK